MIVLLIIMLVLAVCSFAVMTGISNSYAKSEYSGDHKTGRKLKNLRWVVSGAILAVLALIIMSIR